MHLYIDKSYYISVNLIDAKGTEWPAVIIQDVHEVCNDRYFNRVGKRKPYTTTSYEI